MENNQLNEIYDPYTKGITKLISNFFYQEQIKDLNIKDIQTQFVDFLTSNHTLQITELKTNISKIENGFSGFVKTSILNKPIYFEILNHKFPS